MLERDAGRIVATFSISGKQPAALNSDYAAFKHGVTWLTKAPTLELGVSNENDITAND